MLDRVICLLSLQKNREQSVKLWFPKNLKTASTLRHSISSRLYLRATAVFSKPLNLAMKAITI